MKRVSFRLAAVMTAFVCALTPDFVAVRSENSPADALQLLSADESRAWLPRRFSSDVPILSANDFQSLLAAVPTAKGVLDLTCSDPSVEVIAALCDVYAVPHLVLSYVAKTKPHLWTFYVRGQQKDIAGALESVLQYFGWARMNIVSDNCAVFGAVPALLKQSQERTYNSLTFPLSDPASINRSVGQEMRMSGNRITVFLSAPDLTKAIITVQYEKKIGDIGFGNIMPLDCSLFAPTGVRSLETGNLVIAEQEIASVQTTRELYLALLRIVAGFYEDFSDNESVRKVLNQAYSGGARNGPFLLLNLQSSRRVTVGTVGATGLLLTAPVYFLGNTTDIPRNARSPLQISGNFGVQNVATISQTAHQYYRGALLAVEQVNSWENLLENFSLELFNFTAGVTVWDYNFAFKNVYPDRSKLGLAVMVGTSSGVSIKLISFLGDLNFTGPIIGSSTTVNALSSRKAFPTFARTVLADSFITSVYLQMFKRFGWTNCGLFVSNETWGLGFQNDFAALANANGISILNSLQVLPTPIPSVDTLRNFTRNFEEFITTKARVLVIVVNNNAQFVIDFLYEMGLRAGEVQIVANEWMGLSLVTTNDTEVNRRRSALLRGAIQFSPVAYVGAFGARVRESYIEMYNAAPPVYACFFYDSALALAYALDIAIRSGQDYTDSTVLLKSLRTSRFVGCTGAVTFSSDTNDRAPMQYNILNAQFGANTTYITNFTSVGLYDPTSTVLFRFSSNIEWCDGSISIPEDVRRSSVGCPFEDKFNKEFYQGKYLLYGVCAGIVLLTTALTAFIWKNWWNRPLVQLTGNVEIQLQDVILMFGVFLDLVQYVALGPNLTFLSQAASSLMSATTLEIQAFFSFKDGGFGLVWTAVFVVVIVWVLMCLIVFCHLDFKLDWLPCCQFLGNLSESSIPFIGNLLFLPIVSVLMEVFVCTQGVGLSEEEISFSDSYLYEDCFLPCWQGIHLFYVAGSSVLLAIYFPAAVTLRPLWQDLQEQLNIKTFPLFLMVKTVAQTAVIVLSKTVKAQNAVAHALLFLGVMGTFCAFSMRYTCFGYRRTQLWHVLSLLAVLWSAGLSLVHQWLRSSAYLVFVGLLAGGWCGITVFGVGYQALRVPSLLYRKPGVDVSNLFRFAFKPATKQILADLRDNFKKVGHRNSILMLDSERRAVSEGDHLTTGTPDPSHHVLTKSTVVPHTGTHDN